VVAAIPFLAFALPNEYGLYLYSLPGFISLIQAIFPTLAGWLLVFGTYAIIILAYLFWLVKDFVRMAMHKSPDIFVDRTDTIGFLLFYSVVVLLGMAVYYARPKWKKAKDEKGNI
jgi:hypothetical protein